MSLHSGSAEYKVEAAAKIMKKKIVEACKRNPTAMRNEEINLVSWLHCCCERELVCQVPSRGLPVAGRRVAYKRSHIQELRQILSGTN